jgi:hypothetical protein
MAHVQGVQWSQYTGSWNDAKEMFKQWGQVFRLPCTKQENGENDFLKYGDCRAGYRWVHILLQNCRFVLYLNIYICLLIDKKYL